MGAKLDAFNIGVGIVAVCAAGMAGGWTMRELKAQEDVRKIDDLQRQLLALTEASQKTKIALDELQKTLANGSITKKGEGLYEALVPIKGSATLREGNKVVLLIAAGVPEETIDKGVIRPNIRTKVIVDGSDNKDAERNIGIGYSCGFLKYFVTLRKLDKLAAIYDVSTADPNSPCSP
jgi:hypothetical protein